MRNFFVPQSTQVAWVAGRPFFMVTASTSRDAVLALPGLCTKVRYVAESAHFVLWLAC